MPPSSSAFAIAQRYQWGITQALAVSLAMIDISWPIYQRKTPIRVHTAVLDSSTWKRLLLYEANRLANRFQLGLRNPLLATKRANRQVNPVFFTNFNPRIGAYRTRLGEAGTGQIWFVDWTMWNTRATGPNSQLHDLPRSQSLTHFYRHLESKWWGGETRKFLMGLPVIADPFRIDTVFCCICNDQTHLHRVQSRRSGFWGELDGS